MKPLNPPRETLSPRATLPPHPSNIDSSLELPYCTPHLPLQPMSRHKRSRSPSPAPLPSASAARSWSSRSPAVRDACWYYAAGTCNRLHCPYSHCSYRDLLDEYTNRRHFADDEQARREWLRSERFYAYLAESPPSSEQWIAVLPVPLLVKTWEALHAPLFQSVVVAAMRHPSDSYEPTVTVLMAGQRESRIWGSVVLRGRCDQVERGRELFIALMEQAYYLTADSRVLRRYVQPAATQPRYEPRTFSGSSNTQSSPLSPTASAAASRAKAATDTSPTSPRLPNGESTAAAVTSAIAPPKSDSSSPRSKAPPHSQQSPCVLHWARGQCPRPGECPLLHEPYPVVVARLADTSVTSRPARELPSVLRRFTPIVAHLASSSPLAYVVSLPLPCLPKYSSTLMGEKRCHARFVADYCALSHCQFTQQLVTKSEQLQKAASAMDGRSWLAVHAEGNVLDVDKLLECMFTLVDMVRVDVWLNGELTVAHINTHMSGWEKRREREQLQHGEFFAFKSRGITFRVPPHQPVAPASSLSSSPTAASARASLSPDSPASATDPLSPAGSSLSQAATSGTRSADLASSPLSTESSSGVDGTTRSLPLSLAGALVPPTSLPLPSEHSTEVTVAARLAYQLADMLASGHRVTHSTMDALFDDHCLAASAQCVPFIRLLPSAQFACLPLPLDSTSRALLVCEPFDALPICADIEAELGVDLYVPPLPAAMDDDSSKAVMCNVQFRVLAVSDGSSQQLEEAVLRVLMRWEAVKQHLAAQ